MSLHERFCFKEQADLEAKISSLGLDLPLDGDISLLGRRVKIGDLETPNSLAVHPLECRDSQPDGRPSELTFRRYQRFAQGGAGQIWFEATSFMPEGRSSKNQLLLNEDTLQDFSKLCQYTQHAAFSKFGPSHQVMNILELTHTGRHSALKPVIAVHDETLDKQSKLTADYPVISDSELEELEDRFVDAAGLAIKAGFQAVDIKACHGYLVAELLSAHHRSGKYGGSFENRTRLLLNVIDKIQNRYGSAIAVTTRLGVFEGIPGLWGMRQDAGLQEDMDDPIRLVKLLYLKGVRIVNISAGNPYCNPYVGRPFDRPMTGESAPDEHPLTGVSRLVNQTRQIQQSLPDMVVVGTGFSWLRQFLGKSAAANIKRGWMTMAGVGREALAYPNFARDLLTNGKLDPKKTCVTCSLCSQLMREGRPTGCVIFDSDIYRPIYQQINSNTPQNKLV